VTRERSAFTAEPSKSRIDRSCNGSSESDECGLVPLAKAAGFSNGLAEASRHGLHRPYRLEAAEAGKRFAGLSALYEERRPRNLRVEAFNQPGESPSSIAPATGRAHIGDLGRGGEEPTIAADS